MAKLNAKDRKKVAKAEANSGEFQPYPPGKYIGALSEVEVKTSGNGNPMWNVTFTDITTLDGESMPGRQWYTLMLPQDKMPEGYTPRNSKKSPEDAWATYQDLTAGRIKAFFEAFGYSEDSDTDEMIGDKVILQIGIETIQQGAKKGQKTNRVNAVLPLDDDTVDRLADEDTDDDF